MSNDGKISFRTVLLTLVTAGLAAVVIGLAWHYSTRPIAIKGAIVQQDADPRKQSPIEDVAVSVAGEPGTPVVKSEFSGFFRVALRPGINREQPVTLEFRHPDYEPFDLTVGPRDRLYIVHLVPLHPEVDTQSNRPIIPVTNVRVRYSIETTEAVNVGTGVKTFQVQNVSNVSCNQHLPCSPDGKWKAAIGSASLDAGQGNVFENARLSCIAGPCPFTRIESDDFSRGGRVIGVSVRDWSDTTTFLLQAEIFREQVSDNVQELYPVIFGEALNFSLPAAAEGPTIEAELTGAQIVFPLGPSPLLSWATCNVRMGKDQSKSYRCELKDGYMFK